MQVYLLAEIWGVDAPRILKAYADYSDARTAQMKLIYPHNYDVWGPVDVIQ